MEGKKNMAYGKAIELFLVNGTADSLVTAELSNWNGKAIKIPRTEVHDCDREDMKGAGVYFLFCQEEDGDASVYIGEAENVLERLNQHLRDYQTGKCHFLRNDIRQYILCDRHNRCSDITDGCLWKCDQWQRFHDAGIGV